VIETRNFGLSSFKDGNSQKVLELKKASFGQGLLVDK